MDRKDMVAELESRGFEVSVMPSPADGVREQLCAHRYINGVPINFIADLPADPTASHIDYHQNVMHYVMMMLAQQYGYGSA